MLPLAKKDRKKYIATEAKRMARREEVGARRIKQKLDQVYGEENVPSERTISDLISGSNRERIVSPEWLPWGGTPITDDLGFLLRLRMIKQSEIIQMLLVDAEHSADRQPQLTVNEADIAVKLQLSLLGLDPVIQFLIVHEYAERLEFPNDPLTNDLDLLVATRPWSGSKLYGKMLNGGADPRASIRSLNCRGIVEHNAPITNGDQFGKDHDISNQIARLIREGDPTTRLQIWAWNFLDVPWNLALEHRDQITGDVISLWLTLSMTENSEGVGPVSDREMFDWEKLLELGSKVREPHFWQEKQESRGE
jgi:hypothetical protein